jgi:hypothetical protein
MTWCGSKRYSPVMSSNTMHASDHTSAVVSYLVKVEASGFGV